MTNQNPPKPVPTGKSARQRTTGQAAAQRRRRALQDFLDAEGMNATDLARSIGLPTPNAIYNFLNSRSESLSTPTLEAILDQFDDVTFEALTGRKPRPQAEGSTSSAPASNQALPIVAVATAGVWTRSASWSKADGTTVVLPPPTATLGAGGFALLVGPGAEAAYPVGSLLACRCLDAGEPLLPGTRVIVRRVRDRRVEVTVREIALHRSAMWLMSTSTHAEHQEALRVPKSRDGKPRHGGPGFHVEGIVAWAWIPQPGTAVFTE